MSNGRLTLPTDRHDWNKDAFPCIFMEISCQSVSCTLHNQRFHFLISNFRRQNYTSSKFTGKRNLLVNYGYRQLLTEYVINEMMKY